MSDVLVHNEKKSIKKKTKQEQTLCIYIDDDVVLDVFLATEWAFN